MVQHRTADDRPTFYHLRLGPLLQDHDSVRQNILTALDDAHQALVDLATVQASSSAAAAKSKVDIDSLARDIQAEVRNCLDILHRLKVQREVVEDIRNRLSRRRGLVNDDDPPPEELDDDPEDNLIARHFRAQVDDRMAQYEALSDAEKYNKVELYVTMLKDVWEIKHPDQPFRFDGATTDDMDEDLEIVHQHTSFNCPLTLVQMDEPHTSKVCNHSFSKAILPLLRANKDRIECPVSGCNKFIRLSDLFLNKALARKIARYNAAQEELEDNEEDGNGEMKK